MIISVSLPGTRDFVFVKGQQEIIQSQLCAQFCPDSTMWNDKMSKIESEFYVIFTYKETIFILLFSHQLKDVRTILSSPAVQKVSRLDLAHGQQFTDSCSKEKLVN